MGPHHPIGIPLLHHQCHHSHQPSNMLSTPHFKTHTLPSPSSPHPPPRLPIRLHSKAWLKCCLGSLHSLNSCLFICLVGSDGISLFLIFILILKYREKDGEQFHKQTPIYTLLWGTNVRPWVSGEVQGSGATLPGFEARLWPLWGLGWLT